MRSTRGTMNQQHKTEITIEFIHLSIHANRNIRIAFLFSFHLIDFYGAAKLVPLDRLLESNDENFL